MFTMKLYPHQVIMGLFMPPYILCLDFKSKEELQLMPQTMEEHLDELEDQANENEDISFSSIDEDNVHEVNCHKVEPERSYTLIIYDFVC